MESQEPVQIKGTFIRINTDLAYSLTKAFNSGILQDLKKQTFWLILQYLDTDMAK